MKIQTNSNVVLPVAHGAGHLIAVQFVELTDKTVELVGTVQAVFGDVLVVNKDK